ncbi:MAG: DHH family phosphoesterase [Eggerthellaceae bacterium]|nr:DHH family phosphoesterase [Eggerthellaceae bacterium]
MLKSSNTDLKKIADYILSNDKFLVCGHDRPDGDCISSSLALYNILLCLSKHTQPLLCSENELNERYAFLPGSSEFVRTTEFLESTEDLSDWNFFFVDVPNEIRLDKAAKKISRKCKFSLAVDHHPTNSFLGDLHFSDTRSASASLLFWELHKLLLDSGKYIPSIVQRRKIAICAFTGLMSDTGSFGFQNADARAFHGAYEMVASGVKPSVIGENLFFSNDFNILRLRECFFSRARFCNSNSCVYSFVTWDDYEKFGVKESDTEDLVDVIRGIKGVEVCCLIRVIKNAEGQETCRCSLRAKGEYDVAKIAHKFGGGGHTAAAGFNLKCGKEQAFETVEKILNSIE